MILLTGAGGLIGSNVAAELDFAGMSYAVLGCFNEGWPAKYIANRRPRAVISEDIRSFLTHCRKDIDCIVHLGAKSRTTLSASDYDADHDLAVWLWEWCAERRVGFVYASSASLYGDGRLGFAEDASYSDVAARRPLNDYGRSKQRFDAFCFRSTESGGVHPPWWYGLRFFNVYGPNEYHKGEAASIVYRAAVAAHSGRSLRMFAEGGAIAQDARDFVRVEACAQLLLWLIQKRPANGIYNFGSGVATKMTSAVAAVFKALSLAPRIEQVARPDGLWQKNTVADLDKLRMAGWNKSSPDPITQVEDYVSIYLRDPVPVPR